MQPPFDQLPSDTMARATLRGNEYAWPLSEIVGLIDAAEKAGLASIGGQLQFRFPDGGTCECYWVEVDTYRDLERPLGNWDDEVRSTAQIARRQFEALLLSIDIRTEGLRAFKTHIDAFEQRGGDLNQAMCFVWYVRARTSKQLK